MSAKIVGGTTDNVIPASVEMMGTMRTFSAETRRAVQDLVRRVATNVAAAHGIEADVAFDADGPLPASFGGVEAGASNNGRLTFPANLHGNPAIAVPAGFLDGLPIGLQIVGRRYEDAFVLRAARAFEQANPLHDRHPAL